MSPRPDVSEDRKQQIMDAATVVFARQGYEKTRMEDIAREAGLSKGLLYWYFQSKKDLFLELFAVTIEDSVSALRNLGPADETASDRFRFMADSLRSTMGKVELTNVATSFFIQHRSDESVRKVFNDAYQGYLDIYTGLIGDGITRGEFRDDLDLDHIAGSIGAAFDGLVMQALLFPGLDFQTRLDQMVEIFLHGIRREHPAKKRRQSD
jgi:TetR/AcrR family fatty acid metabolism transcriptional regulator